MSFKKKVRRAAKSALREFRPKPGQETPLTNMQEAFIAWNAERLSMTPSDARDRLLTSMAPFDGGHKGKEFRQFCGLAHNVFLPFFSDQEDEIFESYNFHGPLHFLRMLAYSDFEIPTELSDVLRELPPDPSILDFGCGLAQTSRAFAAKFATPKLFLADIPTVRKEFLVWLCARDKIEMTFLDCTREQPIPQIPKFHIAVVTEFFEHVRDPIRYFDAFADRAAPGALLVTNVNDHGAEFMHVSPDLNNLRQHMAAAGVTTLKENVLFRFP